jgi:hypothetical protein
MKIPNPAYKFILVVVAVLLLTACGRHLGQERLGEVAFDCLKDNDFERYSKYIIRPNEARAVLETLRRSEQYADYSDAKKKKVQATQAKMDKLLEKNRIRLRKNFIASFDHGVKKGVQWSKARFMRVELAPEEYIYDLETLQHQHIYIIFKSGHKEYRLRLKNNIKAARGWVIVDGFAWHDK